jgi:hypothetical protein
LSKFDITAALTILTLTPAFPQLNIPIQENTNSNDKEREKKMTFLAYNMKTMTWQCRIPTMLL